MTESPSEGPGSLREALLEEFRASAQQPESTDDGNDVEVQPEASTEPEANETSSEDTQDESEVIQAPEHWSDEGKAIFTELPAPARQYLLEREKQYEQGIQKKSEAIKQYEEALKPFESMLKMRGLDGPTAVRFWANAQAQLDAAPEQALRALAKTYGITLPDASTQQVAEDEGAYTDPEVKKLQNELKALREQNQQIALSQRSAAQQNAIEQVRQFREAVGENGKPLHPYFEQVQTHMQALIANGVAEDLQSAYEQAVWSIPEFRDQALKTAKTEAEQAEANKRAAAAEAAKKAGKSVNGKASKPPPPPKQATLRDDLKAAFEQSLRGEL